MAALKPGTWEEDVGSLSKRGSQQDPELRTQLELDPGAESCRHAQRKTAFHLHLSRQVPLATVVKISIYGTKIPQLYFEKCP